MTDTTTVQEHRQAAATALAEGRASDASKAYADELRAIAGLPAKTETQSAPLVPSSTGYEIPAYDGGRPIAVAEPYSTDAVDAGFTIIGRWKGWPGTTGDALRQRWGSDAAENLAIVDAFGEANPDARDELKRAGLQDHPAVVAAIAMVARRTMQRAGTPTPTTRQTMTTAEDEALQTQLRTLRGQIAEHQQRGESREANRKYQQEQALLAQIRGNRPIVNGSTRTA